MSKYQYVAFRAIDRSVDETNLESMRRQSTQARLSHPKAPEHDASSGCLECEVRVAFEVFS
jgi:hypothetical protein